MRLNRIGEAFGQPVVQTHPLHGGDLSEVARVVLADGREMAVKRGPLVSTEARMLRAMALSGAPVPEVLHQVDDLLCLEWLAERPASSAAWAALGEGLARLHSQTGSSFGWPEHYAFGPHPIDNAAAASWPAFWADQRLAPFVPHLHIELANRVERLCATLPDRLPATPPAALLHGDLWTGNALFGARHAWLIDPACYHGHAEVDLAMLDLFGTPPRDFWQGYGEPEPDRLERRPLYQLFPALVHLRLFGSGYRDMVTSLLDAAGA